MSHINQLNKSLWRKVYGAYRSNQKAKQAYLIAYDIWIQSEWDDKYLSDLNDKSSRNNTTFKQWIDALDLIRAYDKYIAVGIEIDILCSRVMTRTEPKSLQARLTNYRNDIGKLWFEAAGGYNNPIYDLNNLITKMDVKNESHYQHLTY